MYLVQTAIQVRPVHRDHQEGMVHLDQKDRVDQTDLPVSEETMELKDRPDHQV